MSATDQLAEAPPRTEVVGTTDGLRDWTGVLLPWLVSRLVVVSALLLGARHETGRFSWEPLYYWDGVWYLRIAIHGYGGPLLDASQQTPWPFFPLLPGLGRGAEEAGLSMWISMVVISNVALLVALAGVHRLARLHGLSRAQATVAVCMVAFFPTSVVFSMIYPSSLFLAGMVWAFVFARQGRLHLAGLAATVAVLVRPNGFLFLAPLALAVAIPYGWARRTDALRAAVRVCAIPGLALLAWLALMQRWADDAFVFYKAKAGWDEVQIYEFASNPQRSELPHVALGVLGVLAVLLCVKRLPPTWTMLAAVLILPSLLLGVVGLGRYTNEAFPVAMAVAVLAGAHARKVTAAVVVAGATGGVLLAVAIARLLMVP